MGTSIQPDSTPRQPCTTCSHPPSSSPTRPHTCPPDTPPCTQSDPQPWCSRSDPSRRRTDPEDTACTSPASQSHHRGSCMTLRSSHRTAQRHIARSLQLRCLVSCPSRLHWRSPQGRDVSGMRRCCPQSGPAPTETPPDSSSRPRTRPSTRTMSALPRCHSAQPDRAVHLQRRHPRTTTPWDTRSTRTLPRSRSPTSLWSDQMGTTRRCQPR